MFSSCVQDENAEGLWENCVFVSCRARHANIPAILNRTGGMLTYCIEKNTIPKKAFTRLCFNRRNLRLHLLRQRAPLNQIRLDLPGIVAILEPEQDSKHNRLANRRGEVPQWPN